MPTRNTTPVPDADAEVQSAPDGDVEVQSVHVAGARFVATEQLFVGRALVANPGDVIDGETVANNGWGGLVEPYVDPTD